MSTMTDAIATIKVLVVTLESFKSDSADIAFCLAVSARDVMASICC